HAGHLRPAVGAAGDVGVVHAVHALQPGDALDAGHALVARLVGQPGRPDHVADGVEARHPRLAPVVDDDVRLLDLHARLLKAQVLDVADDADGEDDAVNGDFARPAAGLDGGGDGVGPLLQGLH